ncbi:hypothetical protein PGT21_025046 [Puccinia graminis f. sp. tritici]|uniref:Uncharacterized protein n=1 Tax=Puccinia graminis f. sp. tritici TaxID=56615 RepID=A0A5B0PJ36_PUCGR|nr:hypothetical protein PGT21_025046 [Puccinia graminis f. sp. tritici]KAA1123464.1 hypothetical protein PGTUg99_015003 [Puccinia graminis f. sp. tritici]
MTTILAHPHHTPSRSITPVQSLKFVPPRFMKFEFFLSLVTDSASRLSDSVTSSWVGPFNLS